MKILFDLLGQVLSNGGDDSAMAERRDDFLKKRHRIAVAWRVANGDAMVNAVLLQLKEQPLHPIATPRTQNAASSDDPTAVTSTGTNGGDYPHEGGEHRGVYEVLEILSSTGGRNKNTIVCNFCEKITKGGIIRAKQHLIGKSDNIVACKKTPPNVVEELKEYMTTKKSGTTYSTSGSGNMTNIRDFEFGELIGCDESEDDEFADSSNATASAKTKCGTKKGPMDKFCKNSENAINRRKMEMLRQMNIRESMDKNEVLKVHQHIARFWYQASVDGSDFLKTSEKIFELLDAIVEEVGEENVVQVVTDNGSNYVLEDIGKFPLIRKTIRREINLVGFIYAHSSTLSLLRNFINKRELVRRAITRFATSYLTLERLHKEKTNIRKMFTSDEWTLNKLSKEPKGKEAAKVVLMPFIGNSVVYTLKVMAPLVKVLRLVDGERKPAMGYIYEAMDKAKETIIKSFNNNESKYKDVFAIIDKRWNFQLHRPLHAAAHFLNPKFFYDNTDLDFDFEVTNGLFECIKKLIPQFDVQ
ncbi:hypothetical protein GmHk_10G028150 [Glycine max]|nr:hypothetical protein GmHk_10G028150 [Glycine max]